MRETAFLFSCSALLKFLFWGNTLKIIQQRREKRKCNFTRCCKKLQPHFMVTWLGFLALQKSGGMETTSGWAGSSWFSSFFPREEPEACRFLLYLGVTFVIISRNEKMWMWIAVKYGTWNVAQPASGAVHVLLQAGYSPLTAMVLAGRGLDSPEKAKKYLDCGRSQGSNCPCPGAGRGNGSLWGL